MSGRITAILPWPALLTGLSRFMAVKFRLKSLTEIFTFEALARTGRVAPASVAAERTREMAMLNGK